MLFSAYDSLLRTCLGLPCVSPCAGEQGAEEVEIRAARVAGSPGKADFARGLWIGKTLDGQSLGGIGRRNGHGGQERRAVSVLNHLDQGWQAGGAQGALGMLRGFRHRIRQMACGDNMIAQAMSVIQQQNGFVL